MSSPPQTLLSLYPGFGQTPYPRKTHDRPQIKPVLHLQPRGVCAGTRRAAPMERSASSKTRCWSPRCLRSLSSVMKPPRRTSTCPNTLPRQCDCVLELVWCRLIVLRALDEPSSTSSVRQRRSAGSGRVSFLRSGLTDQSPSSAARTLPVTSEVSSSSRSDGQRRWLERSPPLASLLDTPAKSERGDSVRAEVSWVDVRGD